METKEKEIWRDIPGYEGYYQVSDRGNLKRLARTVVYKDGRERFYRGGILKGYIKTTGYRQFGLSANGESRSFTASQLVAMAFLGHTPDGYAKVVDHINGDRSDDRVENLRIVTHRANTSTCFRSYEKELTSKYVGVAFHKETNKWRAEILYEGKSVYLGLYDNELEASKAYQDALVRIEGGAFNPLDYKPVYTSKYKGVGFHKQRNKWQSYVHINGKQKYLGLYPTELEAYEAYQKALSEISSGILNVNDCKPNFTSKYKGVYFNKASNRWRSRAYVNGKQKYVGSYPTELEAYEALQEFKKDNNINK